MPVAKSYQNMEIVGDIYVSSGRQYVKVKHPKTGVLKQVRWYSDSQYASMYSIPIEQVAEATRTKTRKEVLGFVDGYITIFKGDTYNSLDWFKASPARYTKLWGWYFPSNVEIPAPLPEGIEAIQLDWNKIAVDENTLIPEDKITEYVENLIYDAGTSEYVGEIGERLEFSLLVKKTIELDNQYGRSTMHIMEDIVGNIFVWTTSARTLSVDVWYDLKGTIKDHKTYHNEKQTVLTRCTSIKEME